MSRNEGGTPRAAVRELAEFPWIQSPGHFQGALSKVLVSVEESGASFLDFRISSYEPGAYVQTHVHEAKEQVYYFVEGEGLLELDGCPQVVRPRSFVFLPAGVSHGLSNTGIGNLVFFVITTPSGGAERNAPQP